MELMYGSGNFLIACETLSLWFSLLQVGIWISPEQGCGQAIAVLRARSFENSGPENLYYSSLTKSKGVGYVLRAPQDYAGRVFECVHGGDTEEKIQIGCGVPHAILAAGVDGRAGHRSPRPEWPGWPPASAGLTIRGGSDARCRKIWLHGRQFPSRRRQQDQAAGLAVNLHLFVARFSRRLSGPRRPFVARPKPHQSGPVGPDRTVSKRPQDALSDFRDYRLQLRQRRSNQPIRYRHERRGRRGTRILRFDQVFVRYLRWLG